MIDKISVAVDAKRYICSGDAFSRPITMIVMEPQIPKMTKAAQGYLMDNVEGGLCATS